MATVFAEAFLHLVLLVNPSEDVAYRYPVLSADPQFFLILIDEQDMMSLQNNNISYQDIGLWQDIYPAAVVTMEPGQREPDGSFFSLRRKYLIPWSEPEPWKYRTINVLSKDPAETPLKVYRDDTPIKQVDMDLESLFPYDLFVEYLEIISGEVPFLFEDAEYSLFSRSYYEMINSPHDPAMAVEYLTSALQQMGYEPETRPFQLSNCGSHVNVIATHYGAIEPEKTIYVTAHFDDRPFSGRAPGADDNGTGIATLLTMANTLQCIPFRYTIKWVWFSAEEIGLCGSKAYLAYLPEEERDNILANINGDMFGYDGNHDGLLGIHAGILMSSQRLGFQMAEVIEQHAIPLQPDVLTTTALGASDHSSFWKYRIPAVEIGEDFYFDFSPYYHQNLDTIDHMHLDYAYYGGQAILATAMTLAEPVEPDQLKIMACIDRLSNSLWDSEEQ